MKYLSEGSNAALTSVADWKPIGHERFTELLSRYATVCCDDNGQGGVYPTSYRHAPDTTATIWYMPKNGKSGYSISSPVLLMLAGPNKVICFEHLTHGLEKPTVAEAMSSGSGRWERERLPGGWVVMENPMFHAVGCPARDRPQTGPCNCSLSKPLSRAPDESVAPASAPL